MKKQFASLMVGTAILTGTLATVSLQPSVLAQPANAQFPMVETMLEDLNLSEAQKQQLAELRQSTRSEIQTILTAEQQQYFQSVREAGQSLRESFKSMNLTAEQRRQIRGIVQEARGEFRSVLTPEQRSTVRQRIQQQRRDR